MTEPISSIATVTIFKLGVDIVPASLGALVSMQFLPQGLTKTQKAFALGSAWAVGTYFGRGIAAYLNITNPHISDAILFGVSLFGLAFAGTVMQELKPIINAMRKRWIGPVDGGQ